MHIVRLNISGFHGVRSADIALGRHAVLVGPNNSGKTTIIEALALLFGRDRLVRRLFVDDEATLGDPFAEDAHLPTIHAKALQELGFFLVPASRTWDRWISFSSELFRRVVATRGDMPAQAVRAER
jgi:energy-coupling factor transporter ATP-binding protein EcfA2